MDPFLAVYFVSTSYGKMTEKYSRTPFIRISWDGEPAGYVENPDNKTGYIDTVKWGKKFLWTDVFG